MTPVPNRMLPDSLRILDPIRSIKAKLGLLVAVSISISALLTFLCLVVFGWRARYGLTVSVLIGLAVSQLLARGMTAPLRQMTRAAQRMAAGLPPGPVQTRSHDEVGELAVAFTAMADDLATADAQRRELLANVAHELRTPVAALRAELENLVDGVRAPDDAALDQMLGQVEDLSGLLDDLLGLARTEAGITPLRREPIRIADLISDAVEQVSRVRPDRQIEVAVDPALSADVDPQRLRQVLVNLLDNATRHTGPRGLVQVQAGRDRAGALLLFVTDDGPGIPEQDRAAVFERFQRAALDPAQGDGKPTGGTGLGLSIARWAVTLHGGRIEVVPSRAGCRIKVELPATAPPPAA